MPRNSEDNEKLLSDALKALCLTRDYVGEDMLPAIPGWEWYDVGRQIETLIPDDTWADQFRVRITADRRRREERDNDHTR